MDDLSFRPALCLEVRTSRICLHTPHDFYHDEMLYDRKILAQAVDVIAKQVGVQEVHSVA